MFVAAAVQLCCSSDTVANLDTCEELVRRAASHGASLVCTPENTTFLGPHSEKVASAEPLDGPVVRRLRKLAKQTGVHLLVGSVNERSEDPHRCYNTSLMIDASGELTAAYRKIHLFDVDVSPDVRFVESDTVRPGTEPVVANTPLGPIGLSICYDLRFPELYARLVQMGAKIITIPAAFTLTTGKDHWHTLVRARAIETQSWVIAPGQSGRHDDDGLRHSYGHSMIVDPWGLVVGLAPDGPGVALAEVDLSRVDTVRRGIPVNDHRRLP